MEKIDYSSCESTPSNHYISRKQICSKNLQRSVLLESRHCWGKGKRLFLQSYSNNTNTINNNNNNDKNDNDNDNNNSIIEYSFPLMKKAIKNLVHSVRFLYWGIQLLEVGEIRNLSEGNDLLSQLNEEVERIYHNIITITTSNSSTIPTESTPTANEDLKKVNHRMQLSKSKIKR